MKQLYKRMALFLLLALAGGQLGFAQDVNTETIPPVSESTICESALPFTWNDVIFTAAGDSTITLVSSAGADSMVTMRLYVTKTDTVHLFDTLCAGETFDSLGFNIVANTDIDTATTFSSAITACDSVTILHLTVHQPSYSTYYHDVCDSFTWIDGVTYTESTNTPTITLTNVAGCDSVVRLDLKIRKSTTYTDVHEACDSLTWIDGVTYTESNNTATYTLQNVAGCDSVVTLNLTINPTYFFETDTAICVGDSLRWQGNYYKTEGVYWDSNTTAAGCDSIYKLNLTVNPLPTPSIIGDTVICHGQTTTLTATGGVKYQWSSQASKISYSCAVTVSATGEYTVKVTDANECQKVAKTTVTVLPQFSAGSILSDDTVLCEGAHAAVTISQESAASGGDNQISYRWKQNNEVMPNSVGSTLNVNVYNLDPGTYLYTREAKDSTCNTGWTASEGQYTIIIEALPDVHIVAGANTICHGEVATLVATGGASYRWSTSDTTQQITLTGDTTTTYTVTATSSHKCSAFDSLTITVLPTYNVEDTMTICESQLPYEWEGGTFTAAGTKSVILSTVNGCDSVVTMTLTVNLTYFFETDAAICADSSLQWRENNYNTAGVYWDSLKTATGCDSVYKLHLTVNPLPNPSINGDSVVCAGQQTTLVATGGTQNHYEWNTSPGDTNVFVSVGVGNYTVTVTDDKSCSNTASFHVTERAQFSAGSIVSGDTAVCFGSAGSVLIGNSTSSAGGDGLISYRWKCNNVEISNSNSSTISVDVSTLSVGTFSYTREAKDNTCNTGWTASGGQYKITVHQKQTLSLISGDSTQTICYGNSISPVYYRFGGGALSASVSGLPAGVSATLAHDTLYLSGTPSQIGTSSYTVNTVSGNVCEAATRSGTITVLDLPNVTISGDSVFCQGNSKTLTASSNSATSYAWSTGESGNAITVDISGNYTVTVTDGNHCSASASKTVTVNPLPAVTIAGESNFCQGDHVTLTATGAISYKWSDNSTAASITVSSEGAYSVTGTGANGCANTATKTITVNSNYNITVHDTICDGKSYNFFGQNIDYSVGTNTFTDTLYTSKGCDSIITLILTVTPLPTVTIGGDSSFCQGTSTVLRALGESTYTYLWGTDEVSDSIIVSSAGTYTLTATNQYRCTASTTKSVTVDSLPVITISGNNQFCQNTNTTLTASGANTYIWNTGSGANSITVSDGGIYSVTGTNDNGCRGTASVMTFVKPLPVPQIVGPSAICQGDTATLTVYGGNTYVWSNNSTQNSINVTQGGTYTVTATSAEQCSATTSFALTVNPLPTITIIGDISFCQDTNTTLTASGASTYVWSNGASGSTITVNTAGAYTVTGTDNNGCTASADKVVTVDTLPVITITGVTSFCYGSSTGLTASGAGTYIWSTGSGTNSITVMDGGMYSVTGTNGNGCLGTASVMTFVKPLPIPQIVGPVEICQGDVATLTAYGGNTYLWSNGSAQNSINVTQSNTYTVTATSSEECSAIDTFTLTVHSLPTVTITGESSFCQGSSSTLTASGASTYVWSNGATGSTTTVNTAGTYTVTGTDDNGCKNTAPHQLVMNPTYSTSLSDSICQGENYNFFGQNLTESGIYTHTLSSVAGCDSVIILSLTVTPLPIPLITGDNTFCPDEVATLVAGGGTDYLWSTGETTNQIQVETPDTYTVTVTDAYGCSADASFTVTYAPNSLDRLSIVAKRHADGTPYMLVYPQAGLRYQWYKGGDPIPGATQQYYAPDGGLLLNTSYKVHVAPMDPDSCGLFSDEWTYSGTAASKVRILPNPNNGRFRLLLPEGTVDVQILNANGQLVLSRKTDGATELEMDTGLANGLYFVKTYRQDGSFNTEKLIINR